VRGERAKKAKEVLVLKVMLHGGFVPVHWVGPVLCGIGSGALVLCGVGCGQEVGGYSGEGKSCAACAGSTGIRVEVVATVGVDATTLFRTGVGCGQEATGHADGGTGG
jgi:hypothetical protein